MEASSRAYPGAKKKPKESYGDGRLIAFVTELLPNLRPRDEKTARYSSVIILNGTS
jgi:hypothetical protein